MPEIFIFDALHCFLHTSVNYFPNNRFPFRDLRAYEEEINDGLKKLENALQEVFIDFGRNDIWVSVPENSSDKKCKGVFFDAAVATLYILTRGKSRRTIKIVIREGTEVGSEVFVRVSNSNEVTTCAQLVNCLDSLIETVRAAKTTTTTAARTTTATATRTTTATAARTTTATAARTTARSVVRAAAKCVPVGLNVAFAVWDGFEIHSTWKTESETVKEIDKILKKLE